MRATVTTTTTWRTEGKRPKTGGARWEAFKVGYKKRIEGWGVLFVLLRNALGVVVVVVENSCCAA